MVPLAFCHGCSVHLRRVMQSMQVRCLQLVCGNMWQYWRPRPRSHYSRQRIYCTCAIVLVGCVARHAFSCFLLQGLFCTRHEAALLPPLLFSHGSTNLEHITNRRGLLHNILVLLFQLSDGSILINGNFF